MLLPRCCCRCCKLTTADRFFTGGVPQDSAIRIGSVSPGLVRTEFAAAHMKSKRAAEELYATAPALQACDITSAVLFMLLSPANMEVHDVLVRPTAQKF